MCMLIRKQSLLELILVLQKMLEVFLLQKESVWNKLWFQSGAALLAKKCPRKGLLVFKNLTVPLSWQVYWPAVAATALLFSIISCICAFCCSSMYVNLCLPLKAGVFYTLIMKSGCFVLISSPTKVNTINCADSVFLDPEWPVSGDGSVLWHKVAQAYQSRRMGDAHGECCYAANGGGGRGQTLGSWPSR